MREEVSEQAVKTWNEVTKAFEAEMGLLPAYKEDDAETALYRLPTSPTALDIDPTPFEVGFLVDREGYGERDYVIEGIISATDDYGGILESQAQMYREIVDEIGNEYIDAVDGERDGKIKIASIKVPADHDEDELRQLAEDSFWILLQTHGETINVLDRLVQSFGKEGTPGEDAVEEETAYKKLKTALERAHLEARDEMYSSLKVGNEA